MHVVWCLLVMMQPAGQRLGLVSVMLAWSCKGDTFYSFADVSELQWIALQVVLYMR